MRWTRDAWVLRRYESNDNVHSQLARASQPRQALIEPKATQESFGRTQVTPLSSDSGLTDFTMGGTVRGVAWSINPYVGCLHACTYCYVPQTMHLERARWGTYVAPKTNLPAVLREELKTRERKTVYLSTGTDAYQAPEREHRITRSCLELLVRHDWPVDILTRSPLVLRDLDLLTQLSKVRVGMSVPTLDDAARRVLEPQAPPIRARLRTLRALADAGITTYANLAPAYPLTGGVTARATADAFREAGVQWVNESGWRRVPQYLGPMFDRLHKTVWADVPHYVANGTRQAELRAEVFQAFKKAGIPIRSGFYNPPFDLSPQYEATSQLKLEIPLAPAVPLAATVLEPLVMAPTGRRSPKR